MSQLAIFGIGPSLWDYITVFFDNIIKLVYFIYAAVASCLDILQALMRKLAGLDTYWVNVSGDLVEVNKQDPILEFIYGMLGIGQNASTYSALSTVFWSLAIFGLIVLVISTIVAIIKSHYGEDVNKTNPLSYVYTAVKAIFTFAIVPVAVILGIYLSQFLLQTLDNITAGAATEDTLRGIYGTGFEKVEKSPDGLYTHYDYFGGGTTSTAQTFSGLMFRTAGYNANRVRRGQYVPQKNEEGEWNFYTHGGFFGDMNAPSKGNATDADWLAYQIDYAFMNNLQMKSAIYAGTVLAETDTMLTIASVDFFTLVGASKGFSKYNVGLVWAYYYLWDFNIFVGFASIIVGFGLLTNIIIGLMARLLQSAALFLIYPAVLGLAPLDDFGAFKKWRSEFMGYVLMAFGSIIGMNIFFILLPYINEFHWFQFELANYVINSLIIIVGLLSIKAFIAFVSSLIGAKDAQATGEGLSKELGGTLQKAGKLTMGAVNIAKRGASFASPIGIAAKSVAFSNRQLAGEEVEGLNARIQASELSDAEKEANIEKAENDMGTARGNFEASAEGQKIKDKVARIALAKGIKTGSAEYENMERDAIDEGLATSSSADAKAFREAQATIEAGGYNKPQRDYRQNMMTQRQALIAQNNLNQDGSGAFANAASQWARGVGGAFLKGLKEGLPELTGMDLQKAFTGVFRAGNNNKYKDDDIVGSYGGLQNAPKAHGFDVAAHAAHAFSRDGAKENVIAGLKGAWSGVKAGANMMFTPKFDKTGEINDKGKGVVAGLKPDNSNEKRTADSIGELVQKQDAILKALERLSRK